MKNPFLILPIDSSASQGDILRQVTLAMRSGRYDAKQVADAQRILFDPLTRATAEFCYRLDIKALLTESVKPADLDGLGSLLPLRDPET
jgi:hypothetical protein